MPKDINLYINNKIAERIANNSLRTLAPNGDLVDFCSNDYLGFAKSEVLIKRVEEEMSRLDLRLGGRAARTIAGTTNEIVDLEAQLASFHNSEDALIYNSGYTANVGLFSALPYRGDTVIYDELIHASIRDGMQMSRANSYSFEHNNLEQLEKKLSLAKGNKYVAVETVYSMDGDFSPLKEIAEICKKHDAALIVDEAHSNGVFGKKGDGLVSELGLENDVFARVVTFGKAIGSHGAAILGSSELKLFLVNYSRSFIYTTAPAPHQIISIKCAYDMLSEVSDSRFKISKLRDLFKAEFSNNAEFVFIESFSPIQCLIIAGNDRVKAVCKAVQEDGFDVRPIVAPTVPKGKERIRICLHSFNTEEQILGLANSLKKHVKLNS